MKKKLLEKRLSSFASGMLAMALVFTLAGPASAVGEKISYNQIGVRVLRQQMVKEGQTYMASNGQEVPSSITYIDAAGGKTNYLPVRQLSEMLDADVSWNAEANCVELGVPTSSPGDVTITAGVSGGDPEPLGPKIPEYGRVIGALEEVDPAELKDLENIRKSEPSRCLYYTKDTRVQYGMGSSFPEMTVTADTKYGQYLIYSVTNNGEQPVKVTVGRQVTVTIGRREMFQTVSVEPGETLTRAFRIVKDAEALEKTFHFGVVGSLDRDAFTDVNVTLMELTEPMEP